MNKKERELLTKLYWIIKENKNEHHVLYYCKDVLQEIMSGNHRVARDLLDMKFPMIVPPKLSEPNRYEEVSDSSNRYENVSDMTTNSENDEKCSHDSLPRKEIDYSKIQLVPKSGTPIVPQIFVDEDDEL